MTSLIAVASIALKFLPAGTATSVARIAREEDLSSVNWLADSWVLYSRSIFVTRERSVALCVRPEQSRADTDQE